jgi:O-antigen/teichoic acid export membrane protein
VRKREQKAIREGGVAAVAHVFGSMLTGIVALLLSRVLEPSEFAIFALCTSINGVLRIVGRCGINASLLSQKTDPTELEYGTGLSAMIILSCVAGVVGIVTMSWFAQFSNVPNLVWPGIATAAMLPLHVLPLPALTRYERGLQFKPVVGIELVSQFVGHSAGLALAFNGAGVWGPIAGSALRAAIYGILPWVVRKEPIQFAWDTSVAHRLIRFGTGYVLATAGVQSRSLAFLSFTGRFVGPDAVGIVGFALRAVTLAGPIRAAAARVVLPSFAPIAHVPALLRRAVKTAAETETLITIPIFCASVLVLKMIVMRYSREGWQMGAALFPLIAAGAILTAPHTAAVAALYVRGRFIEPVLSTIAHITILAVVLSVFGEGLGMEACGIAAVCAWPAVWLTDWGGRRVLGIDWSRASVAWALAGAASCLAWTYGAGLVLISCVIIGATRRSVVFRIRRILTAVLPEKYSNAN